MILIPTSKAVSHPQERGWTKTFEDHFTGSSINGTNWVNTGQYSFLTHTNWGNLSPGKKQEWNKPSQISVANSLLTITAETMPDEIHTNPDDSQDYTFSHMSGLIHTYQKQFWTPPFWIEAVIKCDNGIGWDAFWLLQNVSPVTAQKEIDILENFGSDNEKMSGNFIWYDPGKFQSKGDLKISSAYPGAGLSSSFFSDAFHTYAVHHTGSAIYWYMDNVLYHSLENEPQVTAVSYYAILQLQLGGVAAPDPDTGTYPLTMQVDRVSVWQP